MVIPPDEPSVGQCLVSVHLTPFGTHAHKLRVLRIHLSSVDSFVSGGITYIRIHTNTLYASCPVPVSGTLIFYLFKKTTQNKRKNENKKSRCSSTDKPSGLWASGLSEAGWSRSKPRPQHKASLFPVLYLCGGPPAELLANRAERGEQCV